MVRTHYSPLAFRFDPSRILALSTAIALHLLALLLLLVPLSRRPAPDAPPPVVPRWQIPITVPTPPVPVPIAPAEPRPVPPTTPVHRSAPTPPTPGIAEATADSAPNAVPAQAAPAQPTFDTGPAMTPPAVGASLQYLRAPAPAYPRTALKDRLEGTVLLQVHVDTEGRPVAVDIARSSGHRVLDQAAQQQVMRQWRFRPAMQDGQAVEAIGLVPVAFSLN
ncbi:energy transducer TonB [Stenotrophomonas sp. HITSZ_GD]|uniref:energy transducer TonB n=1 Tax=Stenotrophomonas sp. HITSZ_GD TaxID=3037248 RepID=UPI00240E95D6|nr:energy transducer TonB [Stenotrophomonas sp. HITSZ_GD]MDG2524460.1 energy transducer TonB [Stenotrophomonas sp. HITSZ_GD]